MFILNTEAVNTNPDKRTRQKKKTAIISLCVAVVIVVLCIALPSFYRSTQIHPFVNALIGSTWGHISNMENEDFCDYRFVDKDTVVCTDRFGEKHLGEWKITDLGKTSTDVFGGLRPIEGKSITIFVCYKSTNESGWEKVYTSDIVMVYDPEVDRFKMFEQPGASHSDVLHEFGPPQ